METGVLATVSHLTIDHWLFAAILSSPAVLFLLRAVTLAYVRRPKSTTREIGPYFTDRTLLLPSPPRPAYSDRLAYVLAEMSDLAYYRFEGSGGMVDDAVESAFAFDLTQDTDLRVFLDRFATEVMSGRRVSRTFLEKVLGAAGFALLDVIDVVETQGFVCKRDVEGEPPYAVGIIYET